jgi:ketosteroid isomerase-like protein
MAGDGRKELVREFLDALGRQDTDALRSMLTPDARWWFPRSVVQEGARPVVGRDEVLAAIVPPRPAFAKDTTTWTFHHLVGEGDLVAAHVDRSSLTAAGRPYESEYHFLVRSDGVRISELWDILDTARAREQISAGPAGP